MSTYIGNTPLPRETQQRSVFTASAGQTTFSTAATGGYSINFVDVYLNGVKLVNVDDYTATDGINIVLSTGAALNDTVEVISYETFSIAGGFVPISGGTFTGTVSFDYTGAIRVPVGTEAQRPSGVKGQFRFNDDEDKFEGYDGVEWGPLGGGGGGGFFKGENGDVGDSATGPGDIFRINEKTLNTNVTIDSDENASATGPLTIASGVTLTVDSGGELVIL